MKIEKKDLIGLGFGSLILVIGFVLGKALDMIDLKDVIIGAFLSIVIIWIAVLVVQVINQTKHEEELNTFITKLKEIIPPTGFDWLLSNIDLCDIESKVKCKDIWIISSELTHDTIEGVFISAVKKNIKRGITYTYIVPQTDKINALIDGLKDIFASHPNQLRIKQIPEAIYQAISVTDITIYNPNMEGGVAPQVFLELPIMQSGYWVETERSAGLKLTGRFKKFAES